MSERTRRPPRGAAAGGSGRGRARTERRRTGRSGPIAFFVSLFIVAIGAIQLVATFHDYALDLARLNDLKRQEAALVAEKKELRNDISRWDDKNYVAAQARERLGFVFPGEQSVTVLNPQAVTGGKDDSGATAGKSGDDATKALPWYSELNYSFEQADQGDAADGAAQRNDSGSGAEHGQQSQQKGQTQ
ncbi:septum formation initiator family protein [Bifidobacterium pullorum subsp. saeculare]|uniref:Septum formation initiator family protein n=1 Tax=Bifidobacterium pullorum subsp. saeculare TaxID=78257 RepID=A0A939B9P8_9BIFI|nr:septum formation initiator family protein [Bifidobacterium pullorum]MBM6699066.1 septum formation initiator family protein [Bifidobacterium pullorum subsp. saeculare]